MKIVREHLYEYNIDSTNTNTAEKISEEQKTYKIIKDVVDSYSKWIGLVGKPENGNFNRHIQMCKDIGISSKNMIIIEQDKDIYNELIKENKIKNYNCIIHNGDFKSILRKYLKKGEKFSLVDFDATAPLSNYEIDLVDIFKKYINQIEILRIVTSSRDINDDIEEINNELNLENYYRPRNMGKYYKNLILTQVKDDKIIKEIENDNYHTLRMYMLSPPSANVIFSEYCKSKDFYCIFENYKGVSMMRNFIISKNKKLLEYEQYFDKMNITSENVYGNNIEKLESEKFTKNQIINYYKIGNNIYRKKFGLIAVIDPDTKNDIEYFKIKYKDLIDGGKIFINGGYDRYDYIIDFDWFYSDERKRGNEAKADLRKMGFYAPAEGYYVREKTNKHNEKIIPKTWQELTKAIKPLIQEGNYDELKKLIYSSKYNAETDYLLGVILDNNKISLKIKKLLAQRYKDSIINSIEKRQKEASTHFLIGKKSKYWSEDRKKEAREAKLAMDKWVESTMSKLEPYFE